MQISEFIRLTINEICDGVINAAEDVAQKTENHPIAPSRIDGKKDDIQKLHNIDFEIFVSVSEDSNSEGVASISILNLGGKKSSQKEESRESSAKINFSIPVVMSGLKKPNNTKK